MVDMLMLCVMGDMLNFLNVEVLMINGVGWGFVSWKLVLEFVFILVIYDFNRNWFFMWKVLIIL